MPALEPETPSQPFQVVSFCTEGNGYRQEAETRLLPSLRRFSCPHHLYIRPDWGSWWDNLFQKPEVIAAALDDFPDRTIVWLDSDAELVAEPTLFQRPDADFSCHWRAAPTGPKLASNTMIFCNNAAVRRLLEIWCRDCAEARADPDRFRAVPTHRRDGLINEQALLQHLLDPPPPDITVGALPLEYSTIFDDVRVERPVVLQHQASRRLRHAAGSDPR